MKIIHTLVVVAMFMGGLHLQAQILGVDYTSEFQTNFREINYVHLMRFDTEVQLGKSVSLAVSSISIAKTREDRLVNDLQAFSNIEEENLPFSLAVCGVNWQIASRHALFMGIRNMNEDYFTSPVTSFFTNSSCGVFPTISANYPVANYPLASLGMHYRFQSGSEGCGFAFQASLYNGMGHNRFSGRENVFRFCPDDDGLFGIAEMAYSYGGSYFSLGTASYCKGGMHSTLWAYAEQSVSPAVRVLAGCSHAFAPKSVCKDFLGLGLYFHHNKCELGVFSDYARFANAKEFASELSFKYQVTAGFYLQPVLHIIATSSGGSACRTSVSYVATIRLGMSL